MFILYDNKNTNLSFFNCNKFFYLIKPYHLKLFLKKKLLFFKLKIKKKKKK